MKKGSDPVMQSFDFNYQQFAEVFARLGKKFRLFGPKRVPGRGRFSDTDLITYADLQNPEDLETAEKSYLSPKSIVFPPDETTFYFTADQFTEPELSDNRETIVFLRPCDINGIERLDRIFLENGKVKDPYYQRRREKLHFFMIECRESFENCFCVAMNANRTDNFATAIRFAPEKVSVMIQNESFLEAFAEVGKKSDFVPEFVKKDSKAVNLPDVEDMPADIFSDSLWDEYDSRCIACGRCNTSCVTCSCFSTVDIFYPDSRNCGERRRVWDGCHLDGFTDMAGGHSFRKDKGDRMRFKTFHKIYDFRKRFSEDMCVGCGRCDDVCPEYISFSSCINKLSDRLSGGKKDEE
ncbi:MAG: anaerobic sulfite reductase subunit [Clostridiales bacterium]|nr:anaerobic sulfite reductase subunit [Clostridiales bacterium]MDN5282912.1 anaerobic sulfite reductase subunit [Candidatus Ozemobacter sp.]